LGPIPLGMVSRNQMLHIHLVYAATYKSGP
jgi:hypothetical protein